MSALNNKYARALTLVLLLEAATFYGVARRNELMPNVPPLAVFPTAIGGWQMVQDSPVEKDVLDVLKADDTLNREYANPSRTDAAYLFVAFFKTQRTGAAPHSPKNCLPGAGWEPLESRVIPVDVPGREAPIVINKYVVAHGDQKSVTLYWYQSHDRIIASEFGAKFWVVADSIRYHRSDTALVKVWVPVKENDIDAATRTGLEFIRVVFPELRRQLPT
ncbi:MAG: EpsI family protein [Acidobacteriia bacterium]|nr:EpsI family protein [Terriglobia bacterium]